MCDCPSVLSPVLSYNTQAVPFLGCGMVSHQMKSPSGDELAAWISLLLTCWSLRSWLGFCKSLQNSGFVAHCFFLMASSNKLRISSHCNIYYENLWESRNFQKFAEGFSGLYCPKADNHKCCRLRNTQSRMFSPFGGKRGTLT